MLNMKTTHDCLAFMDLLTQLHVFPRGICGLHDSHALSVVCYSARNLGIFSNCDSLLQCDYVISEYEDDIVMLFQDGLSQKELERELCFDITGMCKSS